MARCEDHPIEQAHSPLEAIARHVVYVVCGWEGCARRRQVAHSEWVIELRRRAEIPPGPPVVLGQLARVE